MGGFLSKVLFLLGKYERTGILRASKPATARLADRFNMIHKGTVLFPCALITADANGVYVPPV